MKNLRTNINTKRSLSIFIVLMLISILINLSSNYKIESQYKHKNKNKSNTELLKSLNQEVDYDSSSIKNSYYGDRDISVIKSKQIPIFNSRFTIDIDDKGNKNIIDPEIRVFGNSRGDSNNKVFKSNEFPVSPTIKNKVEANGNNSNFSNRNINISSNNYGIPKFLNNKYINFKDNDNSKESTKNYDNSKLNQEPRTYQTAVKSVIPVMTKQYFNSPEKQIPIISPSQCGCYSQFTCPNCGNPDVIYTKNLTPFYTTCPCAQSLCKPCINTTKLHQLSLIKAYNEKKILKLLNNNTMDLKTAISIIGKELDSVIKYENEAIKASKDLDDARLKAFIAKNKMYLNSESAKQLAKATLSGDAVQQSSIINNISSINNGNDVFRDIMNKYKNTDREEMSNSNYNFNENNYNNYNTDNENNYDQRILNINSNNGNSELDRIILHLKNTNTSNSNNPNNIISSDEKLENSNYNNLINKLNSWNFNDNNLNNDSETESESFIPEEVSSISKILDEYENKDKSRLNNNKSFSTNFQDNDSDSNSIKNKTKKKLKQAVNDIESKSFKDSSEEYDQADDSDDENTKKISKNELHNTSDFSDESDEEDEETGINLDSTTKIKDNHSKSNIVPKYNKQFLEETIEENKNNEGDETIKKKKKLSLKRKKIIHHFE